MRALVLGRILYWADWIFLLKLKPFNFNFISKLDKESNERMSKPFNG